MTSCIRLSVRSTCGLAASRRADEGRHGTRLHRHRDILYRMEAAVVDVQVADIDPLGHRLYFSFSLLARAMPRASRLRNITMMIRVRAAAQTRS